VLLEGVSRKEKYINTLVAGSPPWKKKGSRARSLSAREGGWRTLTPRRRTGRGVLAVRAREGEGERRDRVMECTPSAPMRKVPVQEVRSEKWAVRVLEVGWVMEMRLLDHC